MSDAFAHVQAGWVTDIGLCRRKNEDAVLVLPEWGVYVVADGIGGAKDGEVASRAVVRQVRQHLGKRLGQEGTASLRERVGWVREAVDAASGWIRKRAASKGIEGTGTTVAILALDALGCGAVVMHAGDSRVYRYRTGQLRCLTRDHSLVTFFGMDGDEEVVHPLRGVVTRVVGMRDTGGMDESRQEVKANDIFMVCSDGLTGMVSRREIVKVLRREEEGTVQGMARALVDEANRAGGEDNVSVVVIRVGPRRRGRGGA